MNLILNMNVMKWMLNELFEKVRKLGLSLSYYGESQSCTYEVRKFYTFLPSKKVIVNYSDYFFNELKEMY